MKNNSHQEKQQDKKDDQDDLDEGIDNMSISSSVMSEFKQNYYLLGTRQTVKKQWDDASILKELGPSKIYSLTVHHTNDQIVGIQVVYYLYQTRNLYCTGSHKGNKLFGVQTYVLTLGEHEHIIELSGRYDQKFFRLIISTNLERTVTLGGMQGIPYTFKCDPGKCIASFGGGLSTFLKYLEVKTVTIQGFVPNIPIKSGINLVMPSGKSSFIEESMNRQSIQKSVEQIPKVPQTSQSNEKKPENEVNQDEQKQNLDHNNDVQKENDSKEININQILGKNDKIQGQIDIQIKNQKAMSAVPGSKFNLYQISETQFQIRSASYEGDIVSERPDSVISNAFLYAYQNQGFIYPGDNEKENPTVFVQQQRGESIIRDSVVNRMISKNQLYPIFKNFDRQYITVTSPLIQMAGPDITVIKNIYDKLNITKHVTYLVTTFVENERYQVERRYQEFEQLRQVLKQNFPGLPIPALPEKVFFGNLDEEIIEERRRHLQYFCSRLVEVPFFFNFDVTQSFLRNQIDMTDTLQKALEKSLGDLVLQRYSQIFQPIGQISLNGEMKKKYQLFAIFVKRSLAYMNHFLSYTQQLMKSQKKFHQIFSDFQTNFLPSFQTTIISEWQKDCNPPVGLTSEGLSDDEQAPSVYQKKNNDLEKESSIYYIPKDSFSTLYDLIVSEIRDYESIQEGLAEIDALEAKCEQLNKKIFANKFQSKELQQACENDYKNSVWLKEVLIKSYSVYLIDNFKRERQTMFYFVINKVSELEKQNAYVFQKYFENLNKEINGHQDISQQYSAASIFNEGL